jgi:hypothetical protein
MISRPRCSWADESLQLIVGGVMKGEWESMAIDDLFELHEKLQEVLTEKLKAKKVELERRLGQLNQRSKLTERAKA